VEDILGDYLARVMPHREQNPT
ncbi:MAG: hypothetical protein QOF99_3099, partial [Pseudonocardiales bacterium]|nr:hypothetical protein [Pseudonocardiales bacterium]